jgi:hypothetical protein
MASWVSSWETCPARRVAALLRASVSSVAAAGQVGRGRRGLLAEPLDLAVRVVELEQPDRRLLRPAETSSMVSPYLRVSAVSAARRSETPPAGLGSVSSPEAYDATSAARSDNRVGELGQRSASSPASVS